MPLANGVIYGLGILNAPRKTKVTFFCGGEQTEDWGPLSHIDGGCGGSEEAVIYLSRELAHLGHEVEVINSYPHPCHVDGVEWRNVSSLKPGEEFENLILWRSPHFLDKYPIGKAKKTFLWLHDVPQDYWFKPERMREIDHIFALSQYHKSLVPLAYRNKVIVTSNGVDLKQFDQKVERDPKKVIYTSSYDRGLEHLLHIWPDVLKEVPEAELHIYYGWGTFDKLRIEPKQLEWKSWMMCQMRDLAGVHEHGRIDQVTLAKKMLEANVYAYPCHFEEISCISAMKAQVAGCYPLTTNYAALAETNLLQNKVKGNPKHDEQVMEEFKERLILALAEPMGVEARDKMQSKSKETFSWTTVAKQWAKKF
jgi:glycosyltransferase involved in cell wall biosynthesis